MEWSPGNAGKKTRQPPIPTFLSGSVATGKGHCQVRGGIEGVRSPWRKVKLTLSNEVSPRSLAPPARVTSHLQTIGRVPLPLKPNTHPLLNQQSSHLHAHVESF